MPPDTGMPGMAGVPRLVLKDITKLIFRQIQDMWLSI